MLKYDLDCSYTSWPAPGPAATGHILWYLPFIMWQHPYQSVFY